MYSFSRHAPFLTLFATHPAASGPSTSAAATVLPPTFPLSLNFLGEAGAFLLDTGRVIIMWLGRAVPREFLAEVGAAAAHFFKFNMSSTFDNRN